MISFSLLQFSYTLNCAEISLSKSPILFLLVSFSFSLKPILFFSCTLFSRIFEAFSCKIFKSSKRRSDGRLDKCSSSILLRSSKIELAFVRSSSKLFNALRSVSIHSEVKATNSFNDSTVNVCSNF